MKTDITMETEEAQSQPERPSEATEDYSQNDIQSTLKELAKPDMKKELLKIAILGCIALGVFTVFSTWPSLFTAVGGVLIMVIAAKVSEWTTTQPERLPMRHRPVLITGCDTGFGLGLAKELGKHGATVFACCLNANSEGASALRSIGSENLHVLEMDVRKADMINACVEKVQELLNGSGLWGVVNNAGLNILGDVELTTMEQYERTVDINALGMVRVTKAFLPMIRKSKGRVVNVTSVKGTASMPLCAAYAMSKFAAETFSDILRMEMKQFGVQVSIIEPGHFGGITASLEMGRIKGDFDAIWDSMSDEQRECYGREYFDQHMKSVRECVTVSAPDFSPILNAMTNALFSLTPKPRYKVPGGNGWYDHYVLRARLAPFLPESWSDALWMRDFKGWPLPKAVLKDPTLSNQW